ncbi:pyruvate kinase [Oribacterium asaccharolyticum ACB7]|uniref:Pyruvate kinase n=1 Tax=Oribacterium asaccharolyticum ACB7 TaxID=796944 RepID=G9WUU4_9FIRM|nr:pyruvate kinase [Oribacterium asaccharolyticum]EHL11345.1 pyruvate kinase [Oribacterium asaccharolyticum ACB7]
MRRTKMVCTMGPNENDYGVMKAMAEIMDVARFNFSHGDHEEHLERLELLRKVRKEVGRPIAALLDTKGPEIRTGLLEGGQKISLEEGAKIILTTEEVVGTKDKIFINYDKLHEDVKPGNVILIDDGLIGLEVEAVKGVEIHCKVTNGGELGERKGVNVPGVPIQLPSITEKDVEDIKFGLAEDFDFVAASFIRSADAVRQIRSLINEAGSQMKIISKIESQEALDNIDAIIEASDGIMLARGDLGVEIEAKRIPQLQKEIIQKCNYHGKLVITATQMLDSMIRNPRPTRAEVTDVANAVYNGTDAVMLSGESANGKYPIEAAKTMASIVEYTEQFLDYKQFKTRMVEKTVYESIGNAMCAASVTTASELKAAAIVASTLSGVTASMISKYRPITPIYALSPSQVVTRQMMLFWGVTPIWARRAETTDELFESSIEELKDRKLLKSKDICVITAGVLSRLQRKQAPTGTNIMRVMEVD